MMKPFIRFISALSLLIVLAFSIFAWTGPLTYPQNESNYSDSEFYQFNITWEEPSVVDVWIEHNFTGTWANYTTVENISNVYYYNYTKLAAGTYFWQMHSNDTGGKINSTDLFSYIVYKISPALNLTLNNTESNITIKEGDSVKINYLILDGDNKEIELFLNNSLINSGLSSLQNISQFNQTGIYNITARYNASQNFTYLTKELFIIVNPIIPSWSSILIYPQNNSNFTRKITFINVTWTDNNIDTVKIEHNFTGTWLNYTINSNTSNIYHYNYSVSAGNYFWQMHANDTDGNTNSSKLYSYTINKGTFNPDIKINGSAQNMTVEPGANISILVSRTLSNNNLLPDDTAVNVYLNGISILSGTANETLSNNTIFYGYKTNNITYVYNESQNFSRISESYFITVTDLVKPVLSVNYPSSFLTLEKTKIEINYTFNESNLDKLWYTLNKNTSKNIFLPDVNGTNLKNISFAYPGKQLLIINANDTYGNKNSVNVTFYINATYNITSLLNIKNTTLSQVNSIVAFNSSNKLLSNNITFEKDISLEINLTPITVNIFSFSSKKANWHNFFDIKNTDTNFETQVQTTLATQALDYISFSNITDFYNDTDYYAYVRLPKNISLYGAIYYCPTEQVSSCGRINACTSSYTESDTTACYNTTSQYVYVYVPNLGSVFGDNDTIGPVITITTPLNNSVVTTSYNNDITISTNENATCYFSLNNASQSLLTTTNQKSFTGKYNTSLNTNYNITYNCTDLNGNERLSKITFTINDTTAPGIAGPTEASTTSTITLKFTPDEPANYTVTLTGETSLSSSTYSVNQKTVLFTGLSANTLYYYNITQCDSLGNCDSVSGSKSTIPSTTTDTSSSSSTSSSTSPGSSTPVQPKKVTQSFFNPSAGANVMSIPSTNIAIFQLIYHLKTDVTGTVLLTVENIDRPSSILILDNSPYQYLNIDKTVITNDDIEKAIFKFRVEKSWISSNSINPNSIKLYRYTDIWEPLPTEQTNNDANYHYYQSESPGLSYFGISGTKIVITQEEISEEIIPTGETISEINSVTKTKKKSNLFLLLIPVVLLGILIASVGGFIMYQNSMSIQSDDQLKELKEYVSKCKAEGIPSNNIHSTLLKAGWDEYLVNLVLHDVHIPTEELEKLINYINQMKVALKDDKFITESLMKVGWQQEAIADAFSAIKISEKAQNNDGKK